MNICFVNSTRKWGGVKSWTLDLAQELVARKHQVLIVGRPGNFIDVCKQQGLDALAYTFGPDFNPKGILYFMRLLRSRAMDLVVVNVGKDMRIAGLAARMLNLPVMHRVGLAGDMENTFKVRWLHQIVQPTLLVPCRQIKKGALAKLPYLKPQEIKVIHTGKKPNAQGPPAMSHPVRFISTSQLNADKGHGDILQALAGLKNQGYDFEYHVVGTGKIAHELQALAQDLGLKERVIWHGFVNNVRQILRMAHVFLLPSYSEGLPNTILEAMAEGLVCLSRNVGGVQEVWPANQEDLLLPPEAGPQEFSQILQTLLASDTAQLSERAQKFWHQGQNNTLETMTTAFETFANGLLTIQDKNDH